MGSRSDHLLILLSAILVFSLGLGLFLLPHADFSESENRALSSLPCLSLKALTDGSFSEDFRDFCADQFPLRSLLISMKALGEQALGKKENNGILFGKEGYLIPRGEYGDLSVAKANLQAITAFTEQTDLPATALIVPRHVDLLSDLLPSGFSPLRSARLSERIVKEEGLVFPIGEWNGRSDLLYKTDHHWTTQGAFAAYQLLGDFLGYTPKEQQFFEEVTVSENFLGTSYSKMGGIAREADAVTLYRYESDDRFVVENRETGTVTRGFYTWSALEQKDQYQVFLGGNFAHLSVTDPTREDRPRLLLIKDSYANSLIPFLALHFDLTVLDLRYLKILPTDLEDCDRILILQGADTLATDSALGKLSLLSP